MITIRPYGLNKNQFDTLVAKSNIPKTARFFKVQKMEDPWEMVKPIDEFCFEYFNLNSKGRIIDGGYITFGYYGDKREWFSV